MSMNFPTTDEILLTPPLSTQQVIALLETAVHAQDITNFRTLIQAVPWSTFSPSDLIAVIRMALSLEAPLMARRLAEHGLKQYPNHPEINRFAHILAVPTAMPVEPATEVDIKANKEWLAANREAYRGKWVAVHNGTLIADGSTFSDLTANVGEVKGKGILLTQVT
jgi:hypothetical protein